MQISFYNQPKLPSSLRFGHKENTEPMGKNKGKTSRNNQVQNDEFNEATKGLSKRQKQIVHREITGQGMGLEEIKKVGQTLFEKSDEVLDDSAKKWSFEEIFRFAKKKKK